MTTSRRVTCGIVSGVSLFLLSVMAPTSAEAQVSEDFDAAGADWSATIFSDLHGGVWSRQSLGSSIGAPNTSPPLPINEGGDKEGRRTDDPASSYALMPNIPANQVQDGTVDGYIALALPDPATGSRAVGFTLRTGTLGGVNGYMAYLTNLPNSTNAMLRIVRIRNDIIGGAGDVLAESIPIAINSTAENFRLRFEVDGCSLSASVWRVSESGGTIVENVVDLSFALGVQDTLRAVDTELVVGVAGVHAFCRGANSILFDDITVTPTTQPNFVRGDVDNNGVTNVTDFIAIINYYINGDPIPAPLDRADTNDNEFINLTDAVMLASFLNCGSPLTLPAPTTPGIDTTVTCGDFGEVQPAYVIRFDPGSITNNEVEVLVSIDTPEPISVVDFILQFSPSLTPQGTTFQPASTLPAEIGVFELVDGNIFYLGVRRDGCAAELLPAGNNQFLGSLVFDQDGSIPACPSSLPIAWVPDAGVGGVVRRALVATTAFDDKHPDVAFGSCSVDILRGDTDANNTLNASDFILVLNHLFTGGPPPVDCNGQINFDSADANDNEYLTVADPILVAESLFCGGPLLPPPGTCGPDPDDDRKGFDSVDPNYEIRAVAEVSLFKVTVALQAKFPAGAKAVTVALEFDPAVLTPQSSPNPVYCSAIDEDELIGGSGFVDGNRVIVTVVRACDELPDPDPNTGFLTLGEVHFTHSGLSCSGVVLDLVPEHTHSLWGVTYRSTIVDLAFADHHPGMGAVTCREAMRPFIRGDANADGDVDISDPIFNLDFQFGGGQAFCLDAHDSNDDGSIDISDPIYSLAAQFTGGPSIPAPGPAPTCGDDPTPDDPCRVLTCETYPKPGSSFTCP